MLSKQDWAKLDQLYTDPAVKHVWREWYKRIHDKRRARRTLRNHTGARF